tara:strand:+ start:128020 stop:128688 length:669 start_codon:yes stop_codon:yes gene_type:complete
MGHWLKVGLFALLAIAGYSTIQFGWVDIATSQQTLSQYAQGHDTPGLMLILLAGVVYCALGAPRQLLAFAAGFALGPAQGTIVSTAICTAGAALCYLTTRSLLRPMLLMHMTSQISAMQRTVQKNTFLKIMILRLIPVGSNLVTNMLAGASDIRMSPFLGGSALGYIPQMLVFSLAGAGIGFASGPLLAMGVSIFAISALIGVTLYRSQRWHTMMRSVAEKT